MRTLPQELAEGPFTRERAIGLGLTDRMLDGARFERVLPRVWRLSTYCMTPADWRAAARLCVPGDAHLAGISRIQQLGLEYGPALPVRFVVARDLHLEIEGIFLHRTAALPPTDENGVSVAAAFVAYCAQARAIDAIKVGDWLLHEGHTTTEEISTLALAGLWRDGAHEAIWILEHLDPRSRSLKESETRSVLEFAGLPRPEVNVEVDVREDVTVVGDLVYRQWRTVVEYEGSQHQQDRSVYGDDIVRYGLIRRAGHRYVQVTREKLDRPKALVCEVYRELVAAGYDGPPPTFRDQWRLLFLPISVSVGPRLARITGRAVD